MHDYKDNELEEKEKATVKADVMSYIIKIIDCKGRNMGHNKLACVVKKGFELAGYGLIWLFLTGALSFMGLLVGLMILDDQKATIWHCFCVGTPCVFGFIGVAFGLYRLYEWSDDNC